MTLKQCPLSKFVPYCRNPRGYDCAVDVIVSRGQQLTGRYAVLEASGEIFGQTQAARRLSIPEVR